MIDLTEVSLDDLRAECKRRGLVIASEAFWEGAATAIREVEKLRKRCDEVIAGYERAKP